MRQRTIRRNVRYVMEEINVVYSTCSDYNATNADFAGFATMALGQFRDALHQPDLTGEELERMLRDGIQKHRQEGQEVDWTRFVASHMAQTSNANSAV